jgi:hypothetical protein
MDLTAVAITRLAWRDGPVENWHGWPQRRISDGEMMRATVATTRLVRDLIRSSFDEPVATRLRDGPGAALSLFEPVLQIAEPSQRLPDGRTMAQFAPDHSELQVFERHVRELTHQWAQQLVDLGPRPTLTLLACFAAKWCWRWWLTPTWPHVVAGLVRGTQDALREERVYRSAGMLRPPSLDWARLGQRLLVAPDRLSPEEAGRVVRAGLGGLTYAECGLPPVPRDVLPPDYVRLIVPPAVN